MHIAGSPPPACDGVVSTSSQEQTLDSQRARVTLQAYIGTLDTSTVAANRAQGLCQPKGIAAAHDDGTDGLEVWGVFDNGSSRGGASLPLGVVFL